MEIMIYLSVAVMLVFLIYQYSCLLRSYQRLFEVLKLLSDAVKLTDRRIDTLHDIIDNLCEIEKLTQANEKLGA